MILHVDMDAFYASVEERDRPELAGRPVIVGGKPNSRGVVSAANYAAREFGVHSAMPSSQAHRLCPQAIVLPPRIGHYAEVSREIREIFDRFTPLVEPLSLDEAFLDVRGSVQLFGEPEEIGRRIQREIREETALAASVGVAPNKFLAKLASDLDKPNGFVIVEAERIAEFLEPLPVRRLWGVGKAALARLQRLNVETIGQLRQLSEDVLRSNFGKSGEQLWRLAQGIDNRKVVPDHQAKSISNETTFDVDIGDREVLESWLMMLTEQVARRLRRSGLKGKTINLKVRFSDFRTITRSQTLAEPTDVTDEIWTTAKDLLSNRLPETGLPVRLLGVGLTGLTRDAGGQQQLFADDEHDRQSRLDRAADSIAGKFGPAAVSRATGLTRKPGDAGER